MKTKIFIDFDGTLFKNKTIKDCIFELVGELGYTREEASALYQKARDIGPFHPSDLIDSLAKQKNANPEPVKEKFIQLIKYLPKQCFYGDSARFLEKIDRNKYEINLITYGDEKWQKTKVENTGHHLSFDNLYYVGSRDKWNFVDQYLEKDESFVFVDDFAGGVINMKKFHPNCLAICMERKDTPVDNSVLDGVKDIFRVHNFDDVTELLEKKYA